MANVLHDLRELKKAKKAGGGKIIPATDDEKALAAALEKCQSLEECWELYKRYVEPKKCLDHWRAKDVLENSPWGKAWFLDSFIKHQEGFTGYAEELLQKGDFLHLGDLTDLYNEKDARNWLRSAKAGIKQMIRARDKEIKKLTQPR